MLRQTIACGMISLAACGGSPPNKAIVAEGGMQAKRSTTAGKASFARIAEAYRANREAFTYFTCRFKWRTGEAANIEAARRGDLSQAVEHEGLWLVDGERERYDLVCTTANVQTEANKALRNAQGKTGSFSATVAGRECFFLKNESVRARQSKAIGAVNLFPRGVKDGGYVEITPFALGQMGGDESRGPAVMLRRVVDGQLTGTVDGTVTENGRPLISVSLGGKGEDSQLAYRFDSQRGFLPVDFWASDPRTGRRHTQALILEAKDCGSGRWFPMRAIVIVGDSNAPWPRRVRDMRVTELKLERPDPKEFYLDIPAESQISVLGTHDFFTVAHDERIHESQLQTLIQRAIDRRIARQRERKAR